MPGDVMHGFTLGEVVRSNAPDFIPGDLVEGMSGWQDYAAVSARSLTKRDGRHRPEHLVGVLGLTGLAAYHGLFDVGQVRLAHIVFVSAAAGAVGSIAGQLARLAGCHVVGIAGGPDKCDWVVGTLGFHAAVDYKAKDFASALRAACPSGIDVYFDNVGGGVLDAALLSMNKGGRIVCCGAVSSYDAGTRPQGSPLLPSVLTEKRLRMEGFITLDYADARPNAEAQLASWVETGALNPVTDIVAGLEHAPEGLVRLLARGNRGKMAVLVA
jgi:NADPH-dependent curcumin reductase CurA